MNLPIQHQFADKMVNWCQMKFQGIELYYELIRMRRNLVVSLTKHVSICQKETTCCHQDISLKMLSSFKTNLVISDSKLTG